MIDIYKYECKLAIIFTVRQKDMRVKFYSFLKTEKKNPCVACKGGCYRERYGLGSRHLMLVEEESGL